MIKQMVSNWYSSSKSVAYRPFSDNSVDTSISIAFPTLAVLTVLLPLLALFVCIFWSLVFNFESSTSTHCGVRNFLPSISAAIGAFEPQKYIWRLAIGLHSFPRYVVAFMYFNRFKSKLVFFTNIIEITSLLGLTFVSSTESFGFHSKCFTMFMISAFVGMILHSINYNKSKFKHYMTIVNIISGISAVYFYLRHNMYCETGVYTLFAISEYLVVLSNTLFHFQAYYDFNLTVFSINDRKYQLLDYSA